MFDRGRFDHAAFNIATGEKPYFYATVTTQFCTEISPIRIRVRIGIVSLNVESALEIGNLGLYTLLSEVAVNAVYNVHPNFTALVPLGAVHMDAEYDITIILGAKIPLGRTTLAAVFSLRPVIGIHVPMPGANLRSDFNLVPKLGVRVPIVPVLADAEFAVTGYLSIMQLLRSVTLHSGFDLQLKSIRTEESEEMVLEGLNLRPGQSLVIDTDTLEIIVDDQPRVDCWVTGGGFFQFKNGENVLSFSDNASRRNLQVTVIWADRYL